MRKKKCRICKKEWPLSEYYKSRINANGNQLYKSQCKKCCQEYFNNWRIENSVRFNKVRREWNKENRTKLAKFKKTHREKYPEKQRARNAIAQRLFHNRLKSQPCAKCGATPTEGHHEDYSKPLEVIWLCNKHHLEEHGKIQRIELIKELQLGVIQH